MGCKAVKTTGNINNAFGQGTANKHTVQWWFKKFWKGDGSLEDKEHSGRPSEGDNSQLREVVEADPLTTTWEVAEDLSADHPTVIWHLKQIGKVKKLDKWVLHELTTNQKNRHFKVSSSLILLNNSEPFLNQIVMCDEKWILYNNWQWPAQWLDWEEAPKHFPKPNLHPKNGHGHCLVLCCPSDTLQLSESGWNHYLWEVCSENQWDAVKMLACSQHWPAEWAQFFSTTPPTTCHPMLQKLNKLGYEVLVHLLYSPDLSPTDYLKNVVPWSISTGILTTFCRGNDSTTSRMQKMLSKSLSKPKVQIFTLHE